MKLNLLLLLLVVVVVVVVVVCPYPRWRSRAKTGVKESPLSAGRYKYCVIPYDKWSHERIRVLYYNALYKLTYALLYFKSKSVLARVSYWDVFDHTRWRVSFMWTAWRPRSALIMPGFSTQRERECVCVVVGCKPAARLKKQGGLARCYSLACTAGV